MLQRNPDFGWIAAQGFSEESRRRDPDDGEGVSFDDETCAYYGRIGTIDGLPYMMAEHGNGGSGKGVIGWSKEASAERAHAQSGKITSSYIFGTQWTGSSFKVLAANRHAPATGLECRDFLELRHCREHLLIKRVWKEAPTVLRTAFHAAIIPFSHAIEPRRIGDRQRAQHHSMYQREDRRRAANP